MTTIQIAPVNKTLTVAVPQTRAFEVFTAGIDRWWPKSHHLGEAPVRQQVIEPHVGGRWYTIHEDGSQTITGIMKVWDAPNRIVFSWDINPQWKPDTTVGSEVEVRFVAEGANRTRIELQHRDFEHLGEGAETMRAAIDSPGGWGGILENFRKEVESKAGTK